MGSLYGARMAHPGVSVAITRLAAHITKWNKECDRRLERMFSYLETHSELVLSGCLSEEDSPHAVLRFWPDADLNGDEFHTKSTSGCWVELAGQDGRAFPLAWFAKKQHGSAGSTTEAETVSMAIGAREEAIPLQALCELALDRPVEAIVGEDNEATIKAVEKGYSPALRHLPRQQLCSLG